MQGLGWAQRLSASWMQEALEILRQLSFSWSGETSWTIGGNSVLALALTRCRHEFLCVSSPVVLHVLRQQTMTRTTWAREACLRAKGMLSP